MCFLTVGPYETYARNDYVSRQISEVSHFGTVSTAINGIALNLTAAVMEKFHQQK
jgi:hypothetical protein